MMRKATKWLINGQSACGLFVVLAEVLDELGISRVFLARKLLGSNDPGEHCLPRHRRWLGLLDVASLIQSKAVVLGDALLQVLVISSNELV